MTGPSISSRGASSSCNEKQIVHSENSFSDMLLGIPPSARSGKSCLFSNGTEHIFRTHRLEQFGRPYIQIFETNVLLEVARLRAMKAARVQQLETPSTPLSREIRKRIGESNNMVDAELSNLVGDLIALSRFELAEGVLATLTGRKLGQRARFEAYWLAFLIENRCRDGKGSQACFQGMRGIIEHGGIPAARTLDVCTQGVVWHLKRREVNAETFSWCVRTGSELGKSGRIRDPESLSGWYRGLAMLPAAAGDASTTRAHMREARRTALQAMADNPEDKIRSINQLKTFHESSIKEFLYVDRDRNRALEAADALVTLDPLWSLSYAETADIHRSFGDQEAAAELYEQAARLGPPYVGLHLLTASNCYDESGRKDDAKRCRQLVDDLLGPFSIAA